jgi:hypothetical protein
LRSGNHGGKVYTFTEHGQHKALIVVAEIKSQECWLITAYENG